MDARQLRYFVALAEELNFTRAAVRCNISQPPLSRAILLLEEQLGARLFERDKHSVQLTAAGHGLLEDARRILGLIDESADRVRRAARGLRGTLTLGFGGSTVYSLWPRLIHSFSATASDVRLIFRSMPVLDQVDALREGVIDVGLIRVPLLDELIATAPVYREPLAVALGTGHPLLAAPGPIAIAALATSAFVTYEPRRGFNFHADLHALCRLAGFKPTIAHEASSTEAVVGIVACGEGVAIVPHSAHRLRMRGVAFRPLDTRGVPGELGDVTFAIAWRRLNPSAVTLEFVAHAQRMTSERRLGKDRPARRADQSPASARSPAAPTTSPSRRMM